MKKELKFSFFIFEILSTRVDAFFGSLLWQSRLFFFLVTLTYGDGVEIGDPIDALMYQSSQNNLQVFQW